MFAIVCSSGETHRSVELGFLSVGEGKAIILKLLHEKSSTKFQLRRFINTLSIYLSLAYNRMLWICRGFWGLPTVKAISLF